MPRQGEARMQRSLALGIVSLALASATTVTSHASTAPVSIILDTDTLTDCDDTGAMALLHALADDGEVEILGIVFNGHDDHDKHGAVASAINWHFGRPGIPIGVCKRADGAVQNKSSSYSQQIFDEYVNDGLLDSQRPDAVDVYRELLAAADDGSVTIVSIGFLTNIEDLLKSAGDAYDTRNGLDLVRAKVCELSVMGGRYPSGSEYNLSFDNAGESVSDQSSQYVVENWPDDVAPITFGGYEIGNAIITGTGYQTEPDTPMKRAYELAYNSLIDGRQSWDQAAVLYAVRGLSHDTDTYWTVQDVGCNVVAADGSNAWQSSPDRNHQYLIEAMDPSALATVIEGLMVQSPLTPPPEPDTGLLGHWRFDEGAGAVAYDDSGNEADGAIHGCAWATRGGGGALQFDGLDDYVDLGDPGFGRFDFGTEQNFTLMLWVRLPAAPASEYVVLSKYDAGTAPGYMLQILASGHARALIRDGSGSGSDELVLAEGATSIADDAWHHVAAAFDRDGNVTLYVDGTTDGTPQAIGTVTGNLDSAEPLLVGRRGAGDYVAGYVDDVRIYGSALGGAEIGAAMTDTGAPVIDAISATPVTVTEGGIVTCTVTAHDPQSDPLTYGWSMTSGPGVASFASPDAASTAVSFTATGTYELRAIVSDGLMSVSDSLTVTVVAASPSGGGSSGGCVPSTGAPLALVTLAALAAAGRRPRDRS